MRLPMAARPCGGTGGSPGRSEHLRYRLSMFHFHLNSVNLNVYVISL